MPARITRFHPWRPSRKAVEDFAEVCRQTGLMQYLREEDPAPTGEDIERPISAGARFNDYVAAH